MASSGPGIDPPQPTPTSCWLHAGVEVRPSPIEGRGLFARHDLNAGTVLARLGGRLISDADLETLIGQAQRDPARPYVDSVAVNIDENLVLPPGQAIHFGNHSCDPNLWHLDAFTLGARRHIDAGEELTVDYATQTANPRFQLRCCCESPRCRHLVTGEDWRLPALQDRYGAHWVPIVRRCIESVAVDIRELVVVEVDPREPDARMALGRYLDETARRLGDPVFRPSELLDDVDAFTEVGGAFLIMRFRGRVIGCGAVRTLIPGLGELKRMWIDPEQRGRGFGAHLLNALETRSVELGHTRVRLDTNRVLYEAIAMYEARGYRPIPRYNDNVDATHFYEKDLAG